jgi:putative OPT family oligopeptide transporter
MTKAPKKIVELSALSIGIGLLVGVVMTAANTYLGLYAGMTVSASIPAAVIAMGILQGILKRKGVHETNIVQTMASAGESLAAGVIFTLPALVIIGVWNDFAFWPTTFIALIGGLLGIVFMIPLRKALIRDDKTLTYPEGVACAAVIESGASDSRLGLKDVLGGVIVGGSVKLLSTGLKWVQSEAAWASSVSQRHLFFGFEVSPALIAIGYIVKLEIAVLVFLGGAIGWFVAIPLMGTPEALMGSSSLDVVWELWSSRVRYIGVGAMIVAGVWSIFSVRRGILSGVQSLRAAYVNKDQAVHSSERDISLMSMMVIFLLCLVSMFSLYNYLIDSIEFALLTTVVMIFATFLFVAVSSYMVGLVGSSNNPVSGMTISALLGTSVLFLLYGFVGENAILATLGVAAVVCCAACTAGDCSQDLKTGLLLQTSPRSQQIAQILGVVVPAFTIAPVLSLLHNAYGIGEGLRAPQAVLFANLTSAIFGEGTLPKDMILIGAVTGVVIILIDETLRLKKSSFRLYLMPLAVGIYLPITIAMPILLGGLLHFFLSARNKTHVESKDSALLAGSGLIAGEALMGVFLAILLAFGISLQSNWLGEGGSAGLAIVVMGLTALFLGRKALARR